MLRFVVDESTGRAVAEFLRTSGCDVVAVAEIMPEADDRDILTLAAQEGRIVVTNDKDFGELVFRSGRIHAGVPLFRLEDESTANRARMARITMERHSRQLAGSFTVVTEKTIRIRPMKR
jgi:predicted nuclease of predicted toxin-antitoxin system